MRPLVGLPSLLLLSHFISLTLSLILSAPERCGGTHVVTHATAFFGPRPGSSDVRAHVSDVPLFAPRAQAAGRYVRNLHTSPATLAKPANKIRPTTRATALRRLLSTIRSALVNHLDKLADSHTYARDAGLGVGGAADIDRIPPPPPRVRGTAVPPPEREVPCGVWGARRDAGVDPHDVAVSEMSQPTMSDRHATTRATGMSVAADAVERQSAEPAAKNATANPFKLFDACTQLSVPADLAAMKGRVAVVARGDCDFAQKVGFMQNAGAVGVIVVNKNEGEHLANMKRNETKKNPVPISIPAVMISYSDWATILPCRNDTLVVFTAEGEASFDIDYGRDALNWAMMRGMALWILCQCGVNVVRYKRRVSEFRARADAIAALPVDTYTRPPSHREESATPGEEISRQEDAVTESVPVPSLAGPAPASPILDHDPERVGLIASDTESAAASSSAGPAPSSASTAVEDEGDVEEEERVCAVCLDHFETGQQVRLLACGHLYHRCCIDPWLQSSSNCCPLCKREIPNLPPPPTQLHYGSMNV